MKRFFMLVLLLANALTLWAQTGSIRGRVVENGTLQPLVGVNVVVQDSKLGAATDEDGRYLINNVPVGVYALVYTYIGYEKKTIPDIYVKTNRAVFVNTELTMQVIEGQEVVVSAGYFDDSQDLPVSVHTLNYEEIRRTPGAREDISRMLQNLPGVSPSTDDRNDLIIRGGSPIEVLYTVDHMDIPNPNHFGTQGATGGPVSMINMEFVEDMTFMAGGFPAQYGEKLSGVMDISLREGNRYGHNGKIDLNFAGAGGYFEGPLGNGKGSYLVGVHRSFLDFLKGVLDYGGVPIYSNLQGKVVYDLSPKHKWSLLWIGGDDRIEMDQETDIKDFRVGVSDTVDYEHTKFKSRQLSVGMNLTSFWRKNFYTNLNLSHNYNWFFTDVNYHNLVGLHQSGQDELLNETRIDDRNVYDNKSTEQVSALKWDANWYISSAHTLMFGVYVKGYQFDHEIKFTPRNPDEPDAWGNYPEPFTVSANQEITPRTGAYVNFRQRFWDRFVYNIGARYDYNDLIQESNTSPRFNLNYDATERLSFHGGVGRYYQSPELIFITSHPDNKNTLKDIRSDHYIIGMNYLLTANTRLTLEAYRKEYAQYPVSGEAGHEMISLANTGTDYGNNGSSDLLLSEGKGRAFGFEAMVQKKLAENIYGLVSYTYSVSENRALDGVYRPGAFDNRNVFNLVMGYRLNKSWEFSMKWRYAGGVPYTPYDAAASQQAGHGVLDLQRINEERYAPYHRLDIRFDHRSYMKRGTIVEYMSIENLYNRKNIRDEYWNANQDAINYYYQTGIFIVGGMSYEF